MALNIKNLEVERLAAEIAEITGESKTEAIRKALLERRFRLTLAKGKGQPEEELLEQLQARIWSRIPESLQGQGIAYLPSDHMLGFGPDGV